MRMPPRLLPITQGTVPTRIAWAISPTNPIWYTQLGPAKVAIVTPQLRGALLILIQPG
jgi:hypothetical protein